MDRMLRSKKYIAFFVLPALSMFLVFGIIPIGYNFYLSLFRTDLMSAGVFIGFRNYMNLFKDKIFVQSLQNNLLLIVGSFIAHMPLALLLANFLFNKIKGSKIFQSIFFMPSVISGVAVGLMWSFIYNYEFGLVNKILDILRLTGLKRQWLADDKTVMFAIIIVVMWQFVGYHLIIQLAGMKNIPASLYEAAAIDGASKLKQFTYITFPLIKNILKIDAILIATGALKYFDLVFVMTGGGPNHASELLSTYMYYQGFRTLKYGYASAIGTVLLILCVLVIVACNLLFKTEKIEY